MPITFVPNLALQTNFDDYHTIISIDNPTAAGTDYGVRRYALADPNNVNDLVDLIRMPNTLNISEESGINELIITFTYLNTQRRYCNPACFAGFISVLAQLGRSDVVCTGMCFGDATKIEAEMLKMLSEINTFSFENNMLLLKKDDTILIKAKQ